MAWRDGADPDVDVGALHGVEHRQKICAAAPHVTLWSNPRGTEKGESREEKRDEREKGKGETSFGWVK